MSNQEKKLNGVSDEIIKNVSNVRGVRLDKDKVEFLKLISKTKYSGLSIAKLIANMSILKEKNEDWFNELLDDGLAEKMAYQTPTSKVRQTFEGWFITSDGRKILKEVLNKM